MPRGRLRERTVQKVATDWLERDIASRESIVATTSGLEAIVKKGSKLGRGRADGLVAALKSDGSIYTASLEAKSNLTDRATKPKYADVKLLFHSSGVALIATIAAAALIMQADWTWWKWLIPAIVFIGIWFGYVMAFHDRTVYRPVSVIAQAQRYPADEQWIALPADLLNRLSREERRVLEKECHKTGIGLLRISPGRRVKTELRAQSKKPMATSHGYLSCYSRGNQMYNKLEVEADEFTL